MITQTKQAATNEETPIQPPLRWPRIALATLPIIVLNTGWIANSEMKTGGTEITISTLFIGVAFILFVATLLNLGIKKIGGARAALSHVELMMFYSLVSISSVIAGVGNLGFFAPFLTNITWYASGANGYKGLWSMLPSVIGPRDPAILKGFYEGQSTFFQPEIMRAWAMPLATWGVFFLLLFWTTLCLAAIVRRRWEEDEHLPFPIVALPLGMTRDGAPLYKNRLLWIGFAVPCFFHTLNTLASIIPAVPSFPINSAQDLLAGHPAPWNALSPIFKCVHPAGVGIGYLVNTDVLFSMWFFFLLRKAMNLMGVMYNWRDAGAVGQFVDSSNQFPFTAYQSWGAWLALAIAVIWQGRSYFKAYFHRAIKGDPTGQEKGEPLSARTAVFGFLGGFLVLCAFVWWSGGSWWLPVAFFAIHILIMVALTRLESETAVPSPFLAWVAPQTILSTVLGTGGMQRMDSVHMGMLQWFNSDFRASAMPHQLQAFVGQKRAGGSMRSMPLALMIVAAVSIVCSMLWDLQLYYVNGAQTAHVNQWRIMEGSMPWDNVDKWIHHPAPADPRSWAGMAAGAFITGGLSILRSRYTGFPLSPAAYVLNTSWANDLFWLDMLIAWIFKSLFLRYGGMGVYRKFLPLFLGLILGDFVTGAFWSIVGLYSHLDLFRTFST